MSNLHIPQPVAPMIPRTLFNSDHEAFRTTARRFFEEKIAPFHEKWEEQQHLDRSLWNEAGALGLLPDHAGRIRRIGRGSSVQRDHDGRAGPRR